MDSFCRNPNQFFTQEGSNYLPNQAIVAGSQTIISGHFVAPNQAFLNIIHNSTKSKDFLYALASVHLKRRFILISVKQQELGVLPPPDVFIIIFPRRYPSNPATLTYEAASRTPGCHALWHQVAASPLAQRQVVGGVGGTSNTCLRAELSCLLYAAVMWESSAQVLLQGKMPIASLLQVTPTTLCCWLATALCWLVFLTYRGVGQQISQDSGHCVPRGTKEHGLC